MNVQTQYNKVKAGELTEQQFIQSVLKDDVLSKNITAVNTFEDVVNIFKSKGYIYDNSLQENTTTDYTSIFRNIHEAAKKPKYELRADDVNYYEFQKGWRYELGVSPEGVDVAFIEDVDKAKKKALQHLADDPMYYTRIITKEKKENRDDVYIDISKKGSSMKDDKRQMKPIKPTKTGLTPEPVKKKLNEGSDKPSVGLTKKERSAVVKKAVRGKDIGKKGKGFKQVAADASKEYDSKEKGKAVAAAAMWKNIAKKKINENSFEKVVDIIQKDFPELEDKFINIGKLYNQTKRLYKSWFGHFRTPESDKEGEEYIKSFDKTFNDFIDMVSVQFNMLNSRNWSPEHISHIVNGIKDTFDFIEGLFNKNIQSIKKYIQQDLSEKDISKNKNTDISDIIKNQISSLKLVIDKLKKLSSKNDISENLSSSELKLVDKLINNINLLIKYGKDSDGDPLEIITDPSSTYKSPCVYQYVKREGNKIKSRYTEPYEGNKVTNDVMDIKKDYPSDIIGSLRDIVKAYKKAYKKNGVSLPSAQTIAEERAGKSVFSDKKGEKEVDVRDIGYVNGQRHYKIDKSKFGKNVGGAKDITTDKDEAIKLASIWMNEAADPIDKSSHLKDIRKKYASTGNPAVISFTFKDPAKPDEVVQYEGRVKSIEKSKTPGAFILKMQDGASVVAMKDKSGKPAVIYMPKDGKDPIKNPDINTDDAKIFDDILNIGKEEVKEQITILGEDQIKKIKDKLRSIISKKINEYTDDNAVQPKGPDVKKKELEHELKNMTWDYMEPKGPKGPKGDYIDPYQKQINDERISKIRTLVSQLGDEGIAIYNSYAPKGYEIKEDNVAHQQVKDFEDMRPEDLADKVLSQDFDPNSIKTKAAAILLGKAIKDGSKDSKIVKAFRKLTDKSKK